jgi:hypothetical protein
MRAITRLAAVAGIVWLSACSHPVKITPPALTLASDPTVRIDRAVGYLITDQQRGMQVTSGGGGGDKISYTPYRDLESGLYQTLASVFSSVYVVPGAGADAFVADKHLIFVFVPEIATDSSSANILLWNPTDFSVRMHVVASDATGKPVWSRDFIGKGHAPAGGSLVENLAAQQAAADVFGQLQKALLEEPLFRK